jgi:predicted MFS family arabinose efflux permease
MRDHPFTPQTVGDLEPMALPRFLARSADQDLERQPSRQTAVPRALSRPWLAISVVLPFAAGYAMTCAFRTINAIVAGSMAGELDLSAAELGVMTSVFFLAMAVAQLPVGIALDRYGPRRVHAVLMGVAAVGAAVFACGQTVEALMLGRLLIGLGVAGALMAGLKAIVLWLPSERTAFANGWLVMLGTLGSVAATWPADTLVVTYGWRPLFACLSIACLLVACATLLVVPVGQPARAALRVSGPSIADIYRCPRFWQIAPLSATTVATSWSLQGLWAAPWLHLVDGLPRTAVVATLFVMALTLSTAALAFGIGANRLRRSGVAPRTALAAAAVISILAQIAVVARLPIPILLPWAIIAAAGAATVLSFAAIAELFPKSCSGRANAALNLLHLGTAFGVQAGIGLIVQQWPEAEGQPPATAFEAAFASVITLQLAALGWYGLSARRWRPKVLAAHPNAGRATHRPTLASMTTPYDQAIAVWMIWERLAHAQWRSWRIAGIAAAGLAGSLILVLSEAVAMREQVRLHVVTHAGTPLASRRVPGLPMRTEVP